MSATDPRVRATTANGSRHLHVVPEPSTLNPVSTPAREAEVDGLLRMYHEGRIQPEPVVFPAVDLPETAVRVRDDFGLVYGLRLAGCDDRPVPYGRAWAAARLKVAEVTVWRALRRLVAAGVLVDCGELPARGRGNGTSTFLPGNER
jgi:hypothetical protein